VARTKRSKEAHIEQSVPINRRPVHPPTVIKVRGLAGPVRGVIERQFRIDLHDESLCKGEVRRRGTTADERAMIKNAVWAINDIRTYIGLDPVYLSIRNVHFMRPAHYKKAFNEDSGGQTIYRQVYLKDDEEYNRTMTMIRLTHELVHAMAYNLYVVLAEEDEEEDVPTLHIVNFDHKICGLHCSNGEFVGLNEVATEMLASMVRQRIAADEACPFTEEELDAIASGGAYGPQMMLVLKLLDEEFGNVSDPTTWLIWDYLTGTNDFLRYFRRANPTAYRALRLMSDDVESTIEAARMLGYDELAQEIFDEYLADEKDDEDEE